MKTDFPGSHGDQSPPDSRDFDFRYTEEAYRALVDQAPDAIFVSDNKFRFIEVNARGCEMSGYSREEVLRKSIFDFLVPEDVVANPLRLDELRIGETLVAERRLKRKDRTTVPVEVTAKLLSDGRFQGIVRDISQRRREETVRNNLDAALRQSERRFRALIEHSDDAIALFSADGAVLYASPSTTRVIGYQPEELLQRNMVEFIRPDYQEAVGKRLAESLRHPGIGIPAESYVRHKDGEYRFLEGTFTNLIDDPSVGAIVNNYRDTTERKRAEEALRDSEARLRLSVEAANVGLWDWDLKTNQVHYSTEWKSQIGYRDDEISNDFSEWASRVHPDDLESTLATTREFIGNPQGRYEVEFRLRHKDGSYRWINTHANVLRSADGKPERMLGCHIDITKRKSDEAALRETQEHLKSAVAAGSVGTWVWDLVNNRAFADEYLSELFSIKSGSDAEGGALDIFFQAIDEADRPRVQDAIERTIKFDEKYDIEFRVLPRDKKPRWLLGRGRIERDAAGHALRFFGMLMDVTDRKESELALRESEQRLRALSARVQAAREEEGARIAREIHDELGGVLTGIKWDIEECEKVLSGSTNAEPLGLIRQKIPVMTGLLDNTIDTVRRLSSELRPGVLDDLGLVAAIEWQAQQFQQRTGIECSFKAGWDTVDLNRDQATAIFRVFQEVLTNVIRHAQATSVEITMSEADKEFVLEVKDNGRGITESERQNMRSLGLLGMHERVQLIGGTIEISGTKGKGTRVVVRVPLG